MRNPKTITIGGGRLPINIGGRIITVGDDTLFEALRSSNFSIVRLNAARDRAVLRQEGLRSSDGANALVCSFERRFLGRGTGRYQGAIVTMGKVSAADLADLACRHLADTDGFDKAVFRTSYPGASSAPDDIEEEAVHNGYSVRLKAGLIPEVLRLPAAMADFERMLARNARKNIRRCRELFSAQGMRFGIAVDTDLIGRQDLKAIGRKNFPGRSPLEYFESRRLAAEQVQSFQATLRANGGELISVAGGTIEGRVITLHYQANDWDYRAMTPSLNLRVPLIEAVIDRGLEAMVFAGGCQGTLKNYCTSRVSGLVVLERAVGLARLKLKATRLVRPE